LPDSNLGDAVSYTLNQWAYLTRYVEDGEMPIDNNLLERDIRIFGILVSLCTPSLSVCKHWKCVRVCSATRAALPGNSAFDSVQGQVLGTNLIGGVRYDLLGWQNARLD
jgi:hypothetical protein